MEWQGKKLLTGDNRGIWYLINTVELHYHNMFYEY